MTLAAALENPFDLFAPAFAQRALLCVLVLAVVSAAVGWAIVLRDLPFFTHSVGAGAYPVLVLGVIAGISLAFAAVLGAVVFAACLALAARVGRAREAGSARRDALTGLGVAAALAVGAVLAAGAGDARLAASPESLLFGSLLTVGQSTVITLVASAALLAPAAWILFERWLASGFDPSGPGAGSRAVADLALLASVALATGAALPVTGSLLAGALLILPAASVRMFAGRARTIPLLTLPLAALVGLLGLYISLNFDLPTGASIAAVAGGVFFGSAALHWLRQQTRTPRRGNLAIAATLVATLAFAGCSGGSTSGGSSDAAVGVVATTPQIADIARQVGGDAVTVTTLLPAGGDPHDYEPRPKAIAALADADLIFRSGGDIDAWLEPAVKSAEPENPPVDLSRAVVLVENDEGQPNAHWYLSPANIARAAQKVRDELVKADPSARETFRANTNEYLDEIQAANSKLLRCSERVPSGDHGIATGHDDFTYLAKAFGFEVVAQLAETGESEPSASQLQKAVDDARSGDARALVASRGEVTKLEQQVAAKLDIPLLQLYADNLTTGDDASTLLGAVGYDVGRIVNAVTDGAVTCPATQ